MTTMSIETWCKITLFFRGKTNAKRYRFLMIFGYSCPTMITLFTLLAEWLSPECAPYKPRFGEEGCFFAESLSNYIWFYLPMSILLMINAFVFFALCHMIIKMDREKIKIGLKNPMKRSEAVERFLMYLKVFLGMGFLWTMEIAAGMASDNIHESF